MASDQTTLLTSQELLEFLGAGVRWEADPNLDRVPIERDGEAIELNKADVVNKLRGDIRLNLENEPDAYFNQAESWRNVRNSIRGVLDKDLNNAQPDEMRLQALEDEYAKVLENRGIEKNKAREMAKQFARASGQMTNQEPKSTTAEARTVTTARTTTTQPQSEGLRPATQEAMANIYERAAVGNFHWSDYLRHPIWALNQVYVYTKTYVTTLFKKGFSEAGKVAKGAAKDVAIKTAEKAGIKIAKKVAGKVAKEAVKTVATEVATDTVEAALAVAPTGVTQVVAAAIKIAKRVWQIAKLAWSLLPKELRELIKKLMGGLTLGFFFLMQYLAAHLVATGLAAAVTFLVPGGIILAPAAFILGLGLESAAISIASAISGGITAAGAVIAPATFGALIGGTAIATFSLAAIFAPILIGSLAIIATVTPQTQDQEAKTTFRLEQTVEPITIDSYGGEEKKIKYHLTVATTSDKPVTTKSISYVISTAGTDTPPLQIKNNLPLGSVTADTPYKVDYSITISDPNYQNSVILNAVTVVGRAEGESEDETETVTTKLTVGTPKFSQPFGYPASGTIRSLDIEPVHCVNNTNRNDIVDPIRDDSGKPISCPSGYTKSDHCGTLLGLYGYDRQCLGGGIDISGPQTTVYSTIEGTVIKSVFDRGRLINSSGCVPALSPTGFCYPALGGAVYIESLDKKYTVAFLHLAEDELIGQGATVKRGDPIGKTHEGRICETRSDGDYCTATGTHVHYQIFFNQKNNIPFADPSNIGSCKSGAFLSDKDVPALYKSIGDPLATQTCE